MDARRFAPLLVAAQLIAATVFCMPVAAAEPMTVGSLLAKMRDARGTEPTASREEWNVTYAEGGGTLRTVSRGDDYASVRTRGVLDYAYGRVGGRRRHRDENGLTAAERAVDEVPSLADMPSFTSTVTRVRAPVDAWELRRTYASGNVEITDVDPTTFLVLRTVERRNGALESSTTYDVRRTTYDDYRLVGGYRRAFHEVTRAGGRENTTDRRLTAYDPHPTIADSELAVPPSSRCPLRSPQA